MCSVAAAPQTVSVGDVAGETAGGEDQARTSEEEEGGADSNYDRQVSSDKCVLSLCRDGKVLDSCCELVDILYGF